MGCWNETCAITRLPIMAGDKVVVMVPILEKGKPHLFWTDPNPIINRSYLKELEFGTYDDYGWINELEQLDDDSHLYSVFVFQSVWDRILELVKKHPNEDFVRELIQRGDYKPSNSSISDEKFDQFNRVLYFIHKARIDFNSIYKFKGLQSLELDFHDEVQGMIQEGIERIRRTLEEDVEID